MNHDELSSLPAAALLDRIEAYGRFRVTHPSSLRGEEDAENAATEARGEIERRLALIERPATISLRDLPSDTVMRSATLPDLLAAISFGTLEGVSTDHVREEIVRRFEAIQARATFWRLLAEHQERRDISGDRDWYLTQEGTISSDKVEEARRALRDLGEVP